MAEPAHASFRCILQEHLTEQELEELEACEEWVALQASMEELEQDHLVAIALR
jgi:hypothetical protein